MGQTKYLFAAVIFSVVFYVEFWLYHGGRPLRLAG